MKTTVRIILALFIIGAGFTACKKYEEGPGLSLRSSKSRVAGKWKIEKEVDSDGTEHMADADDNTIFEVKKDGSFVVSGSYGGVSFTTEGKWEFGDKKETFITIFTDGGSEVKDESTIIRLTNKEFWLKDSDGDQTHLMSAE